MTTTFDQLDDALLRRGYAGCDELGLDEDMVICAGLGFMTVSDFVDALEQEHLLTSRLEANHGS